LRRIAAVLAASLAIAAVSTLGDFIWATSIPRHELVYGLAHGALLFCAIGLVFGVVAGRPRTGAAAGVAIGYAAAGAFYLLAPIAGFSTMFIVWALVWLALAYLYAYLSDRGPGRLVFTRGAIAAAASGLAFYLISGIWRPFGPEGWDYALHFAAWTIAYFPGFAVLMLGKGSRIPN
jgi:hypothetical protein